MGWVAPGLIEKNDCAFIRSMGRQTTAGKGAATRETILGSACALARLNGLDGLTIGVLADAVGMSKSGVFAHFGSREELQLAVLDATAQRFVTQVIEPAALQPRGLPQLRATVDRWFDWIRHERTGGGCLFTAAASEFDDQPGPVRDHLAQQQKRWRSYLSRVVEQAVTAGELSADADPAQLAFEITGFAMVLHHDSGLFDYTEARMRGLRAFERLLTPFIPSRTVR